MKANPKKTAQAPAAPVTVNYVAHMPDLVSRLTTDIKRTNLYRDSLNPLRDISMPQAVSMMEQAQRGWLANLQWTYGAPTGIESTDPDLGVIIERTLAAVTDAEWQIETISDETKNFDQGLADDQEAALRELYEGVNNMRDAWAHLALARFRGYAHLNPHCDASGRLRSFEILDQWNFARDGSHGDWYWNPKALQCSIESLGLANRLEPQDYICLEWKRCVNRIGLIKFIRSNTAEKDWDFYVEAYGLPGVFLIMPPNLPQGMSEQQFLETAEDAAKSGSGALPHGTDVKTPADSARSTQPFAPRLEWLQKQLVLAGTGGLLTMLAESGSGTLAGSVHEQAFRQLGRNLSNRISEAFQQQFDARFLETNFPGKPALAYFEIKCRQQKITAEIVKDFCALAPFFELDCEEISRETGYTIKSQITQQDPATPKEGGYGSMLARSGRGPAMILAADSAAPLTHDALKQSAAAMLAEAQANDFTPLAEALQHALAAPDFATLQARLKDFRKRLPELAAMLLDKPEAASVMDKIMTAGLFNGLAEGKASIHARRQRRLANAQQHPSERKTP